jgi:RNA polymerase sigma factor (sigma-70 family)
MDAPARDAQHLLQQWFDQFGDGMYGYIYTLVGNRADADDVVQAVFLALVRMDDKVHGIRYPKTYLYRAARHAALRVLVERQRQPQSLDEMLLTQQTSRAAQRLT